MLTMKIVTDIKLTMVVPLKNRGKEEAEAELEAEKDRFQADILAEMKQSAGPGGDVEIHSFNVEIVEI